MSELRPSPPTASPKPAKSPAFAASGSGASGLPAQRKDERETPELRLSIGRAGLGLELGSPIRLGCLTVSDLSVSLPQVRFPLDVSGGVARFRHRRGSLEKVVCEVSARELADWARPRLRGILSVGRPEVWVGCRPNGATLGIFAERPRRQEANEPESVPALAFEVAIAAHGSDVVLYVFGARGLRLAAPATRLAIASMRALIGGFAEEQGSAFVFKNAVSDVVGAILPSAGARLPRCDGARWTALTVQDDVWVAHASRTGDPFVPSSESLSAAESAKLTRSSDAAKDDVRARSELLKALERAPRHPEVSRRVAEIDAHAGGRDEAALATLMEASHEQNGHSHLLAAVLEEASENSSAAAARYKHAAEAESVPVLAALSWERAAALAPDVPTALTWLDRAVAAAPGIAFVRWRRIERNLEVGRLEAATADVQHLEAQAHGSLAKFGVWQEAGRAWKRAGLHQASASLFERALRYAPDDANALSGLGSALVREGRAGRGVTLLLRAAKLAEAAGASRPDITVELARGLADGVGDLSAAVAYLLTVPETADEAPFARGLEGRFRARLGDLAGASLAFEQLRDLARGLSRDTAASRFGQGPKEAVAALLFEGANFEHERRHDFLAAQRHVLGALALQPHNAAALALSVRLGEALMARARGEAVSTGMSKEMLPEMPPTIDESADDDLQPNDTAERSVHPGHPGFATEATEGTSAFDAISFDDASESETDAVSPEDELRATALSQQIQIDPTNDVVASELALLLERLGRYHELLALLLGRLEDATSERRDALVESTKTAFGRASRTADARGKKDEAALLRDALSGL